MAKAKVNNCRCGSRDIQAKFNSEDHLVWVHCDECGNTSTPIHMSGSTKVILDQVVEQWNKENPAILDSLEQPIRVLNLD